MYMGLNYVFLPNNTSKLEIRRDLYVIIESVLESYFGGFSVM